MTYAVDSAPMPSAILGSGEPWARREQERMAG